MLSILSSELTRTLRALLASAALAAVAVPQAQAAGVPGQGTWETTLQGRDLDGNAATAEAYYDTVLNISWLADTLYAYNSGYSSDYYSQMTWSEAQAWVSQLDINGVTGWRLPDVKPVNGSNFNYAIESGDGTADTGKNIKSTQSELSHMFNVTLGEPRVNSGPFNMGSYSYWYGVIYEPSLNRGAWAFYMWEQSWADMSGKLTPWAVHSGDIGVAVVPEPSTYALMGLGLAAVLVASRRRD